MDVVRLLIGRKLANREGTQRKITAAEGVPVMGLDGFASAAYGPEAALTILLAAGAAGLGAIGPIMAGILALLALLFLSYWQTVEAYPTSGGAYTVAKENLGAGSGLLAATALMIDYVLNVAVGISAGVAALTSAAPMLQPYTLELCLGILALITVINLRGTREAGLIFALPTYLFVVSLGGVLAYGLWQAFAAGGHPAPVVAPPPLPPAMEGLGLWLLLRAFASGCTAMTGIEAVSNGVDAFWQPTVRYAHRTLTIIVVVLGVLLAGIAYLAKAYQVAAMDQTQPGYQSVLSQLVAAATGRGFVYYITIGSVLAVLCLSANTSFAGFPRLCRTVAKDGYLPRGFALPGRRLVNTVGILWLASCAAGLLLAFDGITDRLIPLFAVGAFLSFTLSQAGMAVHWARQNSDTGGWIGIRTRLALNGTGAIATGIALGIILAAKFVEGAWITVLTIPCVLALLLIIKRYYLQIDRQLVEHGPMDLGRHEPPVVVIPIRGWDRLAERAVRYGMRLSPDVIAVHLTRLEGPDAEGDAGALRRQWRDAVEQPARQAGLTPPKLVQLPSPYRSIIAPLLKFVVDTDQKEPQRPIAVVIPQLVGAHWWDVLLHSRRVQRLRDALLRHGGRNIAVIIVPWSLEEPQPEAVIAQEEPPIRRARHRAEAAE
jgi:amino acid transporter